MAKRGETRDKIVAAATKVFFAHGFEAASVKMILEEADVVTGSFYHFFPSKEALFEAVVENFLTEYSEKISGILQQDGLSMEEVTERFLEVFTKTTKVYYEVLQGDRLHWTVQSALREKMFLAMAVSIAGFLTRQVSEGKIKKKLDLEEETLAWILLRGSEAVIHSPKKPKNKAELKRQLMEYWGMLIEF